MKTKPLREDNIMDKKLRLNCRLSVNIIIKDFWMGVVYANKAIEAYAAKHAAKRAKRCVQLSKAMERENYQQSFETQLVSIQKEYGHS